MKESAEFYLGFLIVDPKTGWMVTSPSNSPENHFKASDGTTASICYGPSMDMQILNNLFTNCAEASQILGMDPEFRSKLLEVRSKLAPPQIGKYGQLQEWIEDFEETEPGHRHMSHLFALHPGNQITLRGTPDLARAARTSLERRLAGGGGHTGWSRAWIINFWARLEDGDKANENLEALLAKSTLPNLFDNHPPFQIDGNFGATAAIAEMLLQSHTGEIEILPALPTSWSNGSVRGLRARGGYEISMEWHDGIASTVTLLATKDDECRVRYAKPLMVSGAAGAVETQRPETGVVQFRVKAGQSYTLTP